MKLIMKMLIPIFLILSGGSGSSPTSKVRITEDGRIRITEDGQERIIE